MYGATFGKYWIQDKYTGVVEVINKQTSASKVAMRIVRPMFLLLIKHNVSLRSMCVLGIKDIVPDTESRFQETE